MAIRKSMKRVSASPAGSPGRKRRTVDPVASKAEGIAAELAAHEFPNPESATLLATLAPAALRTPKDERHVYHAEVVEMVGAALQMIEEDSGKHVTEFQSKSDGADGEKQARIAAREKAEKELVAQREAVEGAETVVSEDSAAVATAKSALSAALASQRSGDHYLDKAEAKKKDIESAVAESLAPLKELGAKGSPRGGLKTLQKVAKECGLDSTLLKNFPGVLAKLPSERSEFDNVILKELENAFAANLDSINKTLEEGRPGKEERAAAAESAKGAHEAAATKRDGSKEALKEARAALRAGHKTLEDAEGKVASYFRDMKAVMDELDKAKEDLAALREGPRAYYGELKELVRPTIVEEAEAPEAAEPAMEPAVETAA